MATEESAAATPPPPPPPANEDLTIPSLSDKDPAGSWSLSDEEEEQSNEAHTQEAHPPNTIPPPPPVESPPQSEPSSPPVVGPLEPEEKRNLIVNYLPASVTEELFRALFSPFGEIESLRLMKDKFTGQSLGYGFVKYIASEAAQQAIATMNGKQLENKRLRVNFARPPTAPSSQAPSSPTGNTNTNLYICHLDPHITKETLDQIFSSYGTILDSKLLVDYNTGFSKGVGFVRFATPEQAELARQTLNGLQLPGMSRPMFVKFADTPEEKQFKRLTRPKHGVVRGVVQAQRFDPLGGGAARYTQPADQPAAAASYPASMYPPTGYRYPATTAYDAYTHMLAAVPPMPVMASPTGMYCVFVYNVPADVDDNWVYRLFSPYGAIANVKIAKDPATQKPRGYAFVNFLKLEDAQQAIVALNGFQVPGGKQLQVSFKKQKQSMAGQ